MSKFTRIKHFVRISVISFLTCYFGIIVLLNIAPVQRFITDRTERELSQLLSTKVTIDNIDLGLFNRIIIQNLLVNDRNGKELLKASRLSAKFDLPSLLRGKIRINSVQLFGLNAHLNRATPDSQPNFQFIVDALASKDSVKKETTIDLRINTILIRRGQVRYDLLSAPIVANKFDTNHLHVYNLSATLALKALTKDSLNIQVRRMSMNEQSGVRLNRLSLHLVAGKHQARIDDLTLKLPHTEVTFDTLAVSYPAPEQLFSGNRRDVRYIIRMHASVTPSDLTAFIPSFTHFDDRISADISLEGQGLRAECSRFILSDADEELLVKAKALIDGRNRAKGTYLFCQVQHIDAGAKGIDRLYRNLTGEREVPEFISRLQDIHFNGDVSGYPYQLTTHGLLSSGVGNVQANVTMHTDTVTQLHSFSGHITTDGIHLGRLLAQEKKFGETAFDIEMKGFKYRNNKPESQVKGEIRSLEYNGYTYHNIALDGQYKSGGFNGHLALDDENGTVRIDGSFVTSQPVPDFNLHASVRNLRPHALHLTDKYIDTDLSLNLTADFSGRSLDDMQGKISLDSLDIQAPDKENCYYLPNLSIIAGTAPDGQGKELRIESPFMNGNVKGKYSYHTLATSIRRTVQHYIPSLFGSTDELPPTDNQFSFNLQVNNSDFFSKVLNIPIDLHIPAKVEGYLDDQDTRLRLYGNLPEFSYKQTHYESGILLCENPDDRLHCRLSTGMRMKKGSMVNLSITADAKNDRLHTTLNWGNNTNTTYCGKVDATTRFAQGRQGLHTQIDIHPSQAILNDTVWHVHPSQISIDRDSIDIHNFLFEHDDQHIKINGRLGKDDDDSCQVDLRNVNLLYVMDIIQFHAVKFSGLISGNVSLRHILKDPVMEARLEAHNFSLNDALLGHGDIQAHWDKEIGGVRLAADIHENEQILTQVRGYVSPKQKGLDLNIHADGTSLGFLHFFTQSIFDNVHGRAHGNIRLYGPFSDLDLQGSVQARMGMDVKILNTRFEASADSVRFTPGHIDFRNVRLTDAEGHTGRADGSMRHTKLKQLMYNFTFNVDNMLVYNTNHATTDTPFYGHIYATGNASLHGGNNTLNVDGNMRAENHTVFTYTLGTAAEATNNQFITFVDKTPHRKQENVQAEVYHYLNHPDDEDEDDIPLDMHLNLQIEPTTSANMRIIMDPLSGDYISGTGTGSLRINYYNKGDFQIFGNYIINDGIYKMSMQNIIRKDFTLQPGGTVSFNGNPKEATLNVQAIYTVNSASLNDLIANASTSKSTVRVNCLLNLTGELTSPNLSFDLELPTVSEEDRELVRSLTSTEEQMNTQIIYLLGVGKFYTYDYANNTAQTNATSSLAFNTLSGQLNNILSQAINSQNWNVGTNLSTGEKGWSDVEAEAILSGRLLNNRLIINGNFGYRENNMRNTNFVGDFEAIWLLTKNGEFRLRGYNQTNDRYFTKSTLTTQGIGFMYKKDFTYWHELTDWFLRHRRRKPVPTILPTIQEKRKRNDNAKNN